MQHTYHSGEISLYLDSKVRIQAPLTIQKGLEALAIQKQYGNYWRCQRLGRDPAALAFASLPLKLKGALL